MPQGTSWAAPVISMRGVTKSFARGLARASRRTLAITDVDLDVYPGEVILVSGDEGAGKTTLLQCACSILRSDEGVVKHLTTSYVAAVPIFYPFLTVRDVLSLRGAEDDQVDRLLSVLDLKPFSAGVVANLSASAMKRLSIAESLVGAPDVVLIDTSSFEVPSCNTVAAVVELGSAAVIAARNCSSLARIATRIICLEEGRIARTFNTSHSLVAERIH
jgi:ABC-type multidrug transport system ATPase subunit